MSIEDLYWLFSTIAQSLGAIVGIIGMLTVYKLQTMANYIREVMGGSVHARTSFFADSHLQTAEQLIENWAAVKKRTDDSMRGEKKELDRVVIDLTKALDARKQIIFRFFLFLIPNLLFIVLSISGLLYCHSLTPRGDLIAGLTGIAMLFTFCSTIFLCYSLIKSETR